jgi:ligand-binding sensor domain-containing protein
MKHLFAFVFLTILSLPLLGQNPIGLQQVVNFTNAEYKGGNQNWDIQQDRSGIMYFANNEGLLSYNGQSWKLNSVFNKTVVRSVQIAADGKIYVGAQDDIGYFYPDALGVLKYTSLKNLTPKTDSSFTDVWNIVMFNKGVYFRTTEKIFELRGNAITSYRAQKGWLYMTKCNNHLFAEDKTDALMEYKDGKWVFTCQIPQKAILTAILPYGKDSLLIATLKNGLFLLHDHKFTRMTTEIDQQLSIVRINTAQSIGPDLFAIGSAFGGCYIVDRKGRLIQKFSNAQTLQKNNIRSLFTDGNKNIWLGLDDGISFIAYNSPIKQIYPDVNKQSSTYAVRVFDKNLYIGTSDAVFKLPIKDSTKDLSYCNGNFSEVPNTKGQVWNLNDVNAHLLLGNEDGASDIENLASKQIYAFPGTWLFKPLTLNKPSADIISGTYNGLRLLKFERNKFLDVGHLDGSSESLRFLTIDYDQNIVWASHPYRGVFKIALSPDHKKILRNTLYTRQSGLPSSLHNYVFNIKGHNVVATQNGIYEYNPKTDSFYLSKVFFPMFQNTEVQYLNEDKRGNIWFIGNKKVGVIDCSEVSATVLKIFMLTIAKTYL